MLKDASIPHPSAYRYLLFVEPEFRKLVLDLQADLGDDFPEAARMLYGEIESPAYRSVLVLMMGASRGADSFPFLKSAVLESGEQRVACAACYALGLLGQDEARAFLSDQYRLLFGKQDDYARSQMKGVIEAGLATCGEKAIPFLLEQARAELAAEYAKEGPPEADERYFSTEGWLASLRIEHLSPELKRQFLTETDPRLRSSLLLGLARNPSPEVYKFLAEIAEQDARQRPDIIYAIGTTVSDEMLGTVAAPLTESLRRIFLQGEPQTFKNASDLESWIHLGCRIGGAEELDRLRLVFTMDFDKLYGENGAEIRDTIAYALGRMKDGGAMLGEFLKGLPESVDRSVLLAAALRNQESGAIGPDAVRTLLAGIQKQQPNSVEVCQMLWPLARASVEQDAIVATLQRVYEVGTTQIQWNAVDTAGKLGAVSIPFLETVLKGDSSSILQMEAARRLVAICPEVDLKGRFAPELTEILMPGKPITVDVFKESGRLRWAYGDLVRDYYGRFGRSEDLKMLDTIPERVTFGEGVSQEDAKIYRSYLHEQCQQAKDAIRLRVPLQ